MPASGSKLVLFGFFMMCVVACTAMAQGADQRAPGGRGDGLEEPKSMQEMMKKMQIVQAKKDYDEMLDRGQQALKISQDVERDYTSKSQLSRSDLEKLDNLEKLIKKIRGELGGGNGDD